MVAHALPEHLEEGWRQYQALTGQARLFVDLQTAGGKSVWDAYREAGFKGTKPTAASKMANVYREAINFRKWETSQKIEDERELQLERLKKYARGSLGKIYSKSLSLSEKEWLALPDDVKDLVSEMVVEEVTEGSGEGLAYVRKVKLKLEPRMAAESMMAKLGGWYAAAKVDPDLLGVLESMSLNGKQLAALLVKLRGGAAAEKAKRNAVNPKEPNRGEAPKGQKPPH